MTVERIILLVALLVGSTSLWVAMSGSGHAGRDRGSGPPGGPATYDPGSGSMRSPDPDPPARLVPMHRPSPEPSAPELATYRLGDPELDRLLLSAGDVTTGAGVEPVQALRDPPGMFVTLDDGTTPCRDGFVRPVPRGVRTRKLAWRIPSHWSGHDGQVGSSAVQMPSIGSAYDTMRQLADVGRACHWETSVVRRMQSVEQTVELSWRAGPLYRHLVVLRIRNVLIEVALAEDDPGHDKTAARLAARAAARWIEVTDGASPAPGASKEPGYPPER